MLVDCNGCPFPSKLICRFRTIPIKIQHYFVEVGEQILKWRRERDFPGGAVVKNMPANARDTGSSPGPGRSYMPWSN